MQQRSRHLDSGSIAIAVCQSAKKSVAETLGSQLVPREGLVDFELGAAPTSNRERQRGRCRMRSRTSSSEKSLGGDSGLRQRALPDTTRFHDREPALENQAWRVHDGEKLERGGFRSDGLRPEVDDARRDGCERPEDEKAKVSIVGDDNARFRPRYL
jgi:hypothetical protein